MKANRLALSLWMRQRISPEHSRLGLGLLLSLLFHLGLLSLTFGGQGFGLSGFNMPWQDQQADAPDLRVVLTQERAGAMPPPADAGVGSAATSAASAPTMLTLVARAQPVVEPPAARKRSAKSGKSGKSGNAAKVAKVQRKPGEAPLASVPPPASQRKDPAAKPKPQEGASNLAQAEESTWAVPPNAEEPTTAAGATDVAVAGPTTAPSQIATPPTQDTADTKQDAQQQTQKEAEQKAAERQEAERQAVARTEASQIEAARIEAIRVEAARQEAAKTEAARVDAERQTTARQDTVRQDTVKQEAVRQDLARQEVLRTEAQSKETARQQVVAQEATRAEVVRAESARVEAERQEAARQAAARQEAARQEAARQAATKAEAARAEAARQEAARQEATRQDAARTEAAKNEVAKAVEAQKAEATRQEAAKAEAAKAEAARQASARAEAARAAAARADAAQAEAARAAAAREEAARGEAARGEGERQAAGRGEGERQANARGDALRREAGLIEAARLADAQAEAEKREERRRAIGRQLNEEADRRDAAEAAATRQSPTVSSLRRGRLFGHTDPNAALVEYAEAWGRKIQLNMTFEMVRNAAKQRHAEPMVTVAIRSDGSVESVSFVRSSTVPALDDAIRRVIHSQANYPAFSPELLRDYDVIEIRRTWRFDMAIRLY